MAIPEALRIATAMEEGLVAAHQANIVHRDLKPENVLVRPDGNVKILDFGLAKLHEERQVRQSQLSQAETVTEEMTREGRILGTPAYMSPEQAKGEGLDARTDIFSFGSMLYEMVTGEAPFQGKSATEILSAVLRDRPPAPSTRKPDLPTELDWIVGKCLEKEPRDRYQHADELAVDLRKLRRAVETGAPEAATPSGGVVAPMTSAQTATHATIPARRNRWLWPSIAGVAAVALAAAAFLAGRWLAPGEGPVAERLSFHRQTFRRGNVLRARLAPDGKTIVYSAAWEDRPAELFQTRTDSSGSRALELKGADVLSISSRGEMAVLLKEDFLGTTAGKGTLARVPLAGGAPREVLRDVRYADWAPDGENLAVLRVDADGSRLEYPIGNVLRRGGLRYLRVSPDGEHVAFIRGFQGRGAVWVVDRNGDSRMLSSGRLYLGEGLLWSPSGEEILFTSGDSVQAALRAVDLAGNERVLHALSDRWVLHDITSDGRILMEREVFRVQAIHGSAATGAERDLSWLDQSRLVNLSRDGNTVLFTDSGEGEPGIYLRDADGSPAVFLGTGFPWDLSPDARWVLIREDDPRRFTLLPTGAGEARELETGDVELDNAWFINEEEILLVGAPADEDESSLYTLRLDGGALQRVAARPDSGVWTTTWDGKQLIHTEGEEVVVSPMDGSPPSRIQGFDPDFKIFQVSSDARWLYVGRSGELPQRVYRFDLHTGKLEHWRDLMPQDSTGVIRIDWVYVTPDGGSYAYEVVRVTSSDLYILDGLF